jgi:hypothetical protein
MRAKYVIMQYVMVVAGFAFWFFVCKADKMKPIDIQLVLQRDGWFYASHQEMLQMPGMKDSIVEIILNEQKLNKIRNR